MKNKLARALAIVALIFATIFSVTLVMTLVDYKMLHGSIGFIALGSGVFTMMIFIALKADGRGFSMTKMNNEIEMEKIKKELEAKEIKKSGEAEASDGEQVSDASDCEQPAEEHADRADTEANEAPGPESDEENNDKE